MNIFVANHVLCLSCVLAAVGWLVSFVGLCVSATAALTHAISWWVTVYELALVFFVCSVTWANAIQIYRPAVTDQNFNFSGAQNVVLRALPRYWP